MKRLLSNLSALPGWVPGVLAFSLALPVLALAFDGTRLLQVCVLSLSAWLWMAWPHRNDRVRATQALMAGAVSAAFLLDATVRDFILRTYGALPDSSMVTMALANTSHSESTEFVLAYWPDLLRSVLLLLASVSGLGLLLYLWWRMPVAATRPGTVRSVAFGFLLLLLLVALAIKPWRKYHPFVYWLVWTQRMAETRSQWQSATLQLQSLKQQGTAQDPVLGPDSPDTLVVVLSDSINRNHLSLYGYPRRTTPRLDARVRQEPGAFHVFKHAWSADASTVPALDKLFYFGESASPSTSHLLALAAAAGYTTWWISNHDDLATQQGHAQLADVQRMLNKQRGRSTTSLDTTVLPELEQALKQQYRRKLIVVHLLGAHPHYRLRHPPESAPFHEMRDGISEQLTQNDRSMRARTLRNDYDSAIHFHDTVVDRTLEITRTLGGKARWVFLSDHGQDVGNTSDHAGHSATSPDGYRIPLIVWGSDLPDMPDGIRHVPLRADWFGHSLTRLLGIQWKGYRPERDVFDQRYDWSAPPHPIAIDYRS